MKNIVVLFASALSACSLNLFAKERILALICSQTEFPLAWPVDFYIDVLSENGVFKAYIDYEEPNPSFRKDSNTKTCYYLPTGEFACANFYCNPSEVSCKFPYYPPMGEFKKELNGVMKYNMHRIYTCKNL